MHTALEIPETYKACESGMGREWGEGSYGRSPWIMNLNYSLNRTGNCDRNKMFLRLGAAGNCGESRRGTWSRSHET